MFGLQDFISYVQLTLQIAEVLLEVHSLAINRSFQTVKPDIWEINDSKGSL